MDIKYVKQLLELVEKSSVNEIELEEKGNKIRITKSPNIVAGGSPMYAMPQMQQPMTIPVASAPVAAAPVVESKPNAAEKKYHEVKSPIVGTFYRQPSPDSPAYADVGTKVKQGSVLCIVEAMKLMNEIESDIAGTIVKVCIENAKPVEYGQVLFLIEQ